MPLLGAIVDVTPYRWHMGVLSAVVLVVVQAAQIGLNSNNWFVMAVGQAFAWFFYDVQIVASYAYLPGIARMVSEQTMTSCK